MVSEPALRSRILDSGDLGLMWRLCGYFYPKRAKVAWAKLPTSPEACTSDFGVRYMAGFQSKSSELECLMV